MSPEDQDHDPEVCARCSEELPPDDPPREDYPELCERCFGHRVDDYAEGLRDGMGDALPMVDPSVLEAARQVVDAYDRATSVVHLMETMRRLRVALGMEDGR